MVDKKWSGRLDSNQRPHAPQACALPGCATSRLPDLLSCQRTKVKRAAEDSSFRSPFAFLLEQRQQFAELSGELFQSLSLFGSARRHRARTSRRNTISIF